MTSPAHHPPSAVSAGRVQLRAFGPLDSLVDGVRRALLDRSTSSDDAIRQRTADIVARVRREGDDALFALAEQYDGVRLDILEISTQRVRRALDAIDPALRSAMERAAENVARVHRAFLPRPLEIESEPGIIIGRRADPLGRVGVYAPGGRAVYPSSVLMGAVPARVAGVGEIVLCSPAQHNTGEPAVVILAAAALAQVDRVFAIGGAGAIAAMAYGTATVPRVDRIVGPGNAYVAEAKLQVAGAVAIDGPAGPSELLVIADESADPLTIGREMIAQAEHDPLAAVVAVVANEEMATSVLQALERVAEIQPRHAIVASALATRGAVVWSDSVDQTIAFANAYAAEHVLLAVKHPDSILPRLRNQGTVFVGAAASNAFGDYMTGANHVLPTGGLARSYSGLSILDFVRWTTYQRITPAAAARLAHDVGIFADAEGLPGHAAAARAWERTNAELITVNEARIAPRHSYRSISLYNPDRSPSPIDLSDNTNLWGMPPAARHAMETAPSTVMTRYPSLYATRLKAELARYTGVEPEMVVTACGSDDVLDSAFRAVAEPGDRISYANPTFPMIPLFARMNALEERPALLTTSYDVDVEQLVAHDPRIIYLCSPNNPTGTLLSRPAIEHLIERTHGVIVLDEAYAEFADATAIDLLSHSERLLIVRTMSKAFGLAGLRIGYALGAPSLIAEVEKSRGPYKVNAVAELTALAALTDDMPWVRSHITEAKRSRTRLTEELRALGLDPVDSSANFVFVPMPGAGHITRLMRHEGIAVRPFSQLPTVSPALTASDGHAIRISVGPWPMMEKALDALQLAMDAMERVGGTS